MDRCWFFGAMALLGLTAIIWCVVMPIHRRLSAIGVIERAGGSVDTKPGGLIWLRSLVGHDAMAVFSEVRAVYLAGTNFSDFDMVQLQSFRSLDKIDLDSTRVTDAGLVYLKGHSSLEVLDLSGLRITDGSIDSLKTLKSLTVIDLDGTRVTNSGVTELKRSLPGLQINR